MRVSRLVLAVALTVALASGAVAGCSSDESSEGSGGSSANGGSAGSGNAGSGAVGGEGGAAAGGSGNAGAGSGGTANGGAANGGAANGGAAGSSAGSGGALSCPTFADGDTVGNVANSQVTEASGLVASRKQSDVFWLHNDSGDSARVFALKSDGTDLGVFNLTGASATDWEDIALGPGPTSGTDYLYLADIGDNSAQRAFVRVYRVAEPTVGGGGQDLSGAEALEFEYPDGPHNAETLLSDPLNGDLIIVTKGVVTSGIYRAPAPHSVGRTTLTYEGDAAGVMTQLVTGGDISPDGRYIALRTYGAVRLYLRNPGVSVADALKATPCQAPQANEGQGEAVAFAADGSAYFTVSEGSAQPIWRFAKQ
ncbi:MAG: hypothetical protein AB7K71_09830 [Polyangiaceae bacterium]